jgi:multiple sugar transport system permease protein
MNSQRKNRRGVLSLLLLGPFLLAVLVPFLWMALGMFKTNAEFFQPLAKAFFPAHYDWQNVADLLGGKWVPFWNVFGNSLIVSLGQALGAVALSAMAGYAFARFSFRGKRLLFVLAVALILVPRQLFAVPLFSWVNALGLSDSLLGVMLPGVVAGLGVIYFTQVFRQVPEEYLQAARVCGATELRVFLTVLPLVWPALLSYGMIHFILAWHEHLIPMLVLTTETKQTLPLALAKLYDVSQRTPQGVQMAASTFAVIPTAVLFALFHRKFKSSLSEMLVH